MEFHYYSKSCANKKEENKDDNKGIKLIKEFVETLYKEMNEEKKENNVLKRELLLMHLVLLFMVQVIHQVNNGFVYF